MKPKVAITIGDPAGIGPEIVFRAVNSLKVQRVCSPVVFGDKNIIKNYFDINNSKCEFVFTSDFSEKIKFSLPSKQSGLIAYNAIEQAVKMCLNENMPLVTAPVSKESFKLAKTKYFAHTEILANLTKTKKFCMMMICGNINSVMVTRHLPISEISKKLTVQDIVDTTEISACLVRKMLNKNPKIIFSSLNPHCGDNGLLGSQEKQIIIPAIKKLKAKKYNIADFFPCDVAWAKMLSGNYDLIVCMYHDQVMIPLKIINKNKIVNLTAGLPFIRTSPGHGTAFDIAGKNKADATSMIEAILTAVQFSKNLKK